MATVDAGGRFATMPDLPDIYDVALVLSAGAFLLYGLSCVLSDRMVDDSTATGSRPCEPRSEPSKSPARWG